MQITFRLSSPLSVRRKALQNFKAASTCVALLSTDDTKAYTKANEGSNKDMSQHFDSNAISCLCYMANSCLIMHACIACILLLSMCENNMLLLCVLHPSPDEQCWQQTTLLSYIQVASVYIFIYIILCRQRNSHVCSSST